MQKILVLLYFFVKLMFSKVTHFTLLTHFTPLYPNKENTSQTEIRRQDKKSPSQKVWSLGPNDEEHIIENHLFIWNTNL